MMSNRTLPIGIVVISLIVCVLMIHIETSLQPAYVVKSAMKIGLFFGAILLSSGIFRTRFSMYFPDKRILMITVAAALLVFIVILAAYALCGNLIEPEQIRDSLLSKEHIERGNFVFTALYITICNSFIEEIFFRGFVFLTLHQTGWKKIAYIYSAAIFAVYHIGIISTWFSWYMYIAVLAALFMAGISLDAFAQKGNSFLCPWIIHIFANIGINVIGFFIIL